MFQSLHASFAVVIYIGRFRSLQISSTSRLGDNFLGGDCLTLKVS